jgi:protein-S-isoprenylcysteine O-methyltransferase Ste14
MWIIRFVLVGLMAALVGSCGYFLKHRGRHDQVLESGAVNLALVIAYNSLCYAIVALPPDPSVIPTPTLFEHPGVQVGFAIAGTILICAGALALIVTVRMRKTLGGQDVQEGLLTKGIYRYFRHPIYTGIVWTSLGLALATRNVDGLIMFPAVLLLNVAEAVIEEKYDIGVRFRSQYEAYKRRTRMLGPVWCWAAIGAVLLGVVGIPSLL